MKIFSWMQSRFNAKQEAKNPSSSIAATNYRFQEAPREEFSDWPQALLAIGTFGNYNVEPVVSKKCGGEEETKIVREDASTDIAVAAQNLGLEDDESKDQFQDTGNDSMVVNRGGGNDGCLENRRKGGFGRKSMSLLVKKMFVCSSGIVLSPTSGLRDSTSPDKSRMEKMLRAILNKKIYPQNSSSSKKKNSRNGKKYFLETNHHIEEEEEKEEEEDNSDSEEEDDTGDSNDGCKWVKTDSEYIVLEI